MAKTTTMSIQHLYLTSTLILLLLSSQTHSLKRHDDHEEDAIDDDINDNSFVRTMDPRKVHGLRREKLSHFRFYWHDIYSGKNPTAVTIIKPPLANKTFFGSMSMIDDPLTELPDLNSRLLGRAEGFYGVSSLKEAALIMVMNFHIVQGKYNGSTITILGRNMVFDKVREMPVIGGSGLFRFARGYARASTHTFDQSNGDAVVEYNVYVLHYT